VTSCGFPKEVQNGYWNSTGLTESATATLVCLDGYFTTSAKSITCNSDGTWTISITAKCEANRKSIA